MTWFAAFAIWPAPTSPTWVVLAPITSKQGMARAIASCEPPAMIESVPASAPISPPDTGAST